MSYQLLALDLDGTVVGADVTIRPDVKEAVAAAQRRGVHVTIATGRTFSATLPFADELGIDDAVICYQGGLTCHVRTGEVYDRVLMPGELAAEGLRLLEARDICVVAMIDDQSFISRRRPELERYTHFHPEGIAFIIEPNLADYVRENPPAKLLFIADPEVVEHELLALGTQFAGRLTPLRSHLYFGELTPLGVSKGTALERLAARLGVARERVVAIGDQENDLPMITWAGLGLAMGNAIPEVQAAARAVIPSVEEGGVAWAIHRYLLGA